jgi:hypothetical protein
MNYSSSPHSIDEKKMKKTTRRRRRQPTVKQMARTAHFGTMGTWTSKGRQVKRANGLYLTTLVIHERCWSAQNRFRCHCRSNGNKIMVPDRFV